MSSVYDPCPFCDEYVDPFMFMLDEAEFDGEPCWEMRAEVMCPCGSDGHEGFSMVWTNWERRVSREDPSR